MPSNKINERTVGAPSKKPDNLLKLVQEYIKTCEDSVLDDGKLVNVALPTLAGLQRHLGIAKSTLQEWEKQDEKLSALIGEIIGLQEERLINNGLLGSYNPTIAKLLLGKHGYSDKQETDNKHEFPAGIEITYVKSTEKAPNAEKD